MGLETDFAHLRSRVDEVESAVVGVSAGHRLLAQQMAEIVVEQQAAREHRQRQEARLAGIEARLIDADHRMDKLAEGMLTVADTQTAIVARLDVIAARVETAAEVTEDISAAIRWIERLRKVLIWIGSVALAVGSIWAGVKLAVTGHAPPPPPPPPGGPY